MGGMCKEVVLVHSGRLKDATSEGAHDADSFT